MRFTGHLVENRVVNVRFAPGSGHSSGTVLNGCTCPFGRLTSGAAYSFIGSLCDRANGKIDSLFVIQW